MRQSDVYELLKKHGPMTVNQLVDIAYPDTPDHQLTARKTDINKRLNQLMMRDMAYVCGKTDNLVGHKQNIWKTWE